MEEMEKRSNVKSFFKNNPRILLWLIKILLCILVGMFCVLSCRLTPEYWEVINAPDRGPEFTVGCIVSLNSFVYCLAWYYLLRVVLASLPRKKGRSDRQLSGKEVSE